jgi:hypothetical protein
MPRWCNPIRLVDHRAYDDYLDYSGCYEIGFYRAGVFTAYYIGRSGNLRRRIASYLDSQRCHSDAIWRHVDTPRNNLYFRVLRTEGHHGLEARLQDRYGVGRRGAYAWNQRVERKHLCS